MIIKACKNLNVEPKKVFTVGDTNSDVEAGKSAGCIVIGIKIKADYTIDNLSDLVNLLKET
jgi:phosphoglycolate phosphatase-like HAD superfamily hydrolase